MPKEQMNIEPQNFEGRYFPFLYIKAERHAAQAPALRERILTSTFDIPCSIFDIQTYRQLTSSATPTVPSVGKK